MFCRRAQAPCHSCFVSSSRRTIGKHGIKRRKGTLKIRSPSKALLSHDSLTNSFLFLRHFMKAEGHASILHAIKRPGACTFTHPFFLYWGRSSLRCIFKVTLSANVMRLASPGDQGHFSFLLAFAFPYTGPSLSTYCQTKYGDPAKFMAEKWTN